MFENGQKESERNGSEGKKIKMKLSEVNCRVALIYRHVWVLLYSVWLHCFHMCP